MNRLNTAVLIGALLAPAASAAPGEVLDESKISATEGGFGGKIINANFGSGVTSIPDPKGVALPTLIVGPRRRSTSTSSVPPDRSGFSR